MYINNNIIAVICISIIIIYIFYNLYSINKFSNINNDICDTAPEIFRYDSTVDGPTIFIIGTTHGNEPAGYYTIKTLMDMLNNKKIILEKGKLILIPVVNYCGFKLNIRNRIGFGDINRMYYDNTDSIINKTIIDIITNNLTSQSDFILDFHEGWGFHKLNNDSIGSTLSPAKTIDSIALAIQMKNNVNMTILNETEQFLIRVDDPILLNDCDNYVKTYMTLGTLSSYVEKLGKNYILVETSGQDDIQDINIRINQGIVFINTLLSYYGLINNI